MKGEFEKTVQHIKSQAEHTERQIKQQFEKLHRFLRDEEEATITALREEEEQKKQTMKEKLEETNRHISALSHTIKDMEEMMKASDVCFLKSFSRLLAQYHIITSKRFLPECPICKRTYFGLSGSTRFAFFGHNQACSVAQPIRSWTHDEESIPCLGTNPVKGDRRQKKERSKRAVKRIKASVDCVSSAPVILDPNTAQQYLFLSDDLTSVRKTWDKQPLPDNPERINWDFCVLGSEGFNSGTHSWDVEVKESSYWRLGVIAASNQGKGRVFFKTDVWSVDYHQYRESPGFIFRVKQDLDRVRVNLDYDRGTVSFSDPVTNTHLHTLTATFTHTLFPFFCCDFSSSLRILPVYSQ
ncbi:Nuclear factor 7, ovary [Anabarilius grahami]|uniref:Nuclear factor 7, ovary n=1 Tax=Anabarilius grahami TaxID=495550 RepID=A0A3N0YKW6_ANAGA|nr:Nuclear factor 7, ovary [Anabarilius grahami]